MNFDSITVFLAVVEYGSISSAANHLFTSQSNVSAKIQNIEDELGSSLILRGKGHRSIQLTGNGEKFLKIARQLDSNFKKIDVLRSGTEKKFISIGAVDGINTFTFVPFYKKFISDHPDICLEINTYHSSEIYNRLVSNDIDIGFVSHIKQDFNISTRLLYEEPMIILCNQNSDYYNGISPYNLPADKEIYLRFDKDFQQWHNEIWPGKQYVVRVSTGTMLSDYLQEPGRWSLVGISTAMQQIKATPLSMFSLDIEPPVREYYLAMNKYSHTYDTEAITIFFEDLKKYIKANINLRSKISDDFSL